MAGKAVERWTQAALEEALRLGSLDPECHYEILHGELSEKVRQGWPHSFAIDALIVAFRGLSPEQFHVSAQTPLKVGQNLPEPDFRVLRGALRSRREAPAADETLLVVEVADTTLTTDARIKAPMYAEAGIPFYWIVDLKRRRVEVRSRPEAGGYAETRIFEANDTLPPAFECCPTVSVSDLLVDEN